MLNQWIMQRRSNCIIDYSCCFCRCTPILFRYLAIWKHHTKERTSMGSSLKWQVVLQNKRTSAFMTFSCDDRPGKKEVRLRQELTTWAKYLCSLPSRWCSTSHLPWCSGVARHGPTRAWPGLDFPGPYPVA